MNVIVVWNIQEDTVRMPLISVLYLLPTVTMEAVWMVLVPSPVCVTPDTLETFVKSTSMNVKQVDARMGNVKTSSMTFTVHVILDGQEFSAMQILMTVFWTLLDLVHVMILEQVPVLTVTPHTHVSVWMAILVTTALLSSIPAIPIPVNMVEHAPTHQSLLLNALVLREF
jgi:hypothetical protein